MFTNHFIPLEKNPWLAAVSGLLPAWSDAGSLTGFIQPKIFERMARTKNGRLVLVRFAVAMIDGEVCGRILSAEPIGELVSLEVGKLVSFKKRKYYLAAPKKETASIKSGYQSKKILSPFSFGGL